MTLLLCQAVLISGRQPSAVVGSTNTRNTTYTVRVLQSEPCIMEDQDKVRGKPHSYTGFCVDVIEKLSHDLGFKYTIETVNPPNQEWIETCARAAVPLRVRVHAGHVRPPAQVHSAQVRAASKHDTHARGIQVGPRNEHKGTLPVPCSHVWIAARCGHIFGQHADQALMWTICVCTHAHIL